MCVFKYKHTQAKLEKEGGREEGRERGRDERRKEGRMSPYPLDSCLLIYSRLNPVLILTHSTSHILCSSLNCELP